MSGISNVHELNCGQVMAEQGQNEQDGSNGLWECLTESTGDEGIDQLSKNTEFSLSCQNSSLTKHLEVSEENGTFETPAASNEPSVKVCLDEIRLVKSSLTRLFGLQLLQADTENRAKRSVDLPIDKEPRENKAQDAKAALDKLKLVNEEFDFVDLRYVIGDLTYEIGDIKMKNVVLEKKNAHLLACNKEISKRKSELKGEGFNLKKRIDVLETDLATKANEASTLRNQNADLRNQIGDLQNELADLKIRTARWKIL